MQANKFTIISGLPVALRVTPRRTPWFAGLLQQPRMGCEEGEMRKQTVSLLGTALLAIAATAANAQSRRLLPRKWNAQI